MVPHVSEHDSAGPACYMPMIPLKVSVNGFPIPRPPPSLSGAGILCGTLIILTGDLVTTCASVFLEKRANTIVREFHALMSAAEGQRPLLGDICSSLPSEEIKRSYGSSLAVKARTQPRPNRC